MDPDHPLAWTDELAPMQCVIRRDRALWAQVRDALDQHDDARSPFAVITVARERIQVVLDPNWHDGLSGDERDEQDTQAVMAELAPRLRRLQESGPEPDGWRTHEDPDVGTVHQMWLFPVELPEV